MRLLSTLGLAVSVAQVVAGCGASAREMYCAPSKRMPGDEHPLYVECWDRYEQCRANAAENDRCDPKRTVHPYGFTEERQDTTAEWYETERWVISEQECERAHAETPNGTRNRSGCSAR